MNYTTANDQLTGRNRERRKIANNTYLERRNDNIAVRLHNTDIITFTPAGATILNTDGWLTVTTKARINEFQDVCRVWSERGVWYLRPGRTWTTDDSKHVAFADGITVSADGMVQGAGEDPARVLKLKRRIKSFSADYMKAFVAGEVPAPSAGDCFYCMLSVAEGNDKGRGLGEVTHDTSHIESHLAEKYFVPSLLARAVKRFQVSRAAYNVLAKVWNGEGNYPEGIERAFGGSFDQIGLEQLGKSLRRYLTEQFGMQA